MQDLIKRYFWVLGAAVVLVCAVFAAKATSHVVEAKFLGDSAKAPKVHPVVPSPMQPVKQERSKDGARVRDAQHVLLRVHAAGGRDATSDPSSDHRRRACRSCCSRRWSAPEPGLVRDDRQHREPEAGRVRGRRSDSGRDRQAQGDPLQVRRLREQRPHRAPRPRRRHARPSPRRSRRPSPPPTGEHERRAAGVDRQRHQEDRRQQLRDRQVARRQGPREPDGASPRARASFPPSRTASPTASSSTRSVRARSTRSSVSPTATRCKRSTASS